MLTLIASLIIETSALKATLNNHNVRIIHNTDKCYYERNILAYYSHNNQERYISLCTSRLKDKSRYLNTLKHEAIHAIQFCNNTKSLVDPRYSKLNYIDPRYTNLIYKYYPKRLWDIESEAVYLSNKLTTQNIINIMNERCS